MRSPVGGRGKKEPSAGTDCVLHGQRSSMKAAPRCRSG